MIRIESDERIFNYRVVGVAIERDRVLLHRAAHEDFWSLPGGRGEVGETATASLARELREELDAAVRVGRLLWIADTFFEWRGRSWHELGLYFLVRFADQTAIDARGDRFRGDEEGIVLLFEWFSLDALPARLYPTFLHDRLRALPDAPEYLVHHDPADEL